MYKFDVYTLYYCMFLSTLLYILIIKQLCYSIKQSCSLFLARPLYCYGDVAWLDNYFFHHEWRSMEHLLCGHLQMTTQFYYGLLTSPPLLAIIHSYISYK